MTRRHWTAEEDGVLRGLVSTHGADAHATCRPPLCGTRALASCSARAWRARAPAHPRTGTQSWAAVAVELNAALDAERYGAPRTNKQCRDRWHNQLESGIRKDEWTPGARARTRPPPQGAPYRVNRARNDGPACADADPDRAHPRTHARLKAPRPASPAHVPVRARARARRAQRRTGYCASCRLGWATRGRRLRPRCQGARTTP